MTLLVLDLKPPSVSKRGQSPIWSGDHRGVGACAAARPAPRRRASDRHSRPGVR
jgi:hypothetical protein